MTDTRTTTDIGQELARLRANLLGGRGPGATDDEIARNTRDRPTLGAVPAAVELAVAAGQSRDARAGSPLPDQHGTGGRPNRLRVAGIGAVTALALRAVLHKSASVRSARRGGPLG